MARARETESDELEQLRAEVAKLQRENDRLRARLERPRARRIPAVYSRIGAPPADPLDATEWVHRLLVASVHRAAHDSSISEAESRREISQLAAQVKDLVPTTRLNQARRAVIAEQVDLDNGGGPELVNARPFPAGGRGAGGDRPQARRGRPPKRTLR